MINKQRVYEILTEIPRGQVTTYKEVARLAGTRAYRAIGQIISKNPNAPDVPCHRVVCFDGRLGGYAGGREKCSVKEELLAAEGVHVQNGKIRDVEKICWRSDA